MNLAPPEGMVNPGEQGDSQVVDTSTRSQPTAKRPSNDFKRVMAEHGEAFALVKRLGMRSDAQPLEHARGAGSEDSTAGRGKVVEGYAAWRAVVYHELLAESEAGPNDLADAMATLDAINPASPEWMPTFLHVSELVEARVQEVGADAPARRPGA
ncbi:MAG TPA: hypothetical protein VFK05_20685 [Polyangiaceae bacterium]|nr:hypothetical protein [Polyangiaceae bacterium]